MINSVLSKFSWHKSWQAKFEITEKKFPKTKDSYTSRRADVVLMGNIILEIQNSSIPFSEVEQRRHDYGLYGHKIIWLINGASGVEINGNVMRLAEQWRYVSFRGYKYIFIDRGGLIYKIQPNMVADNIVLVDHIYSMPAFIDALKCLDNDLWEAPDSVPVSLNKNDDKQIGSSSASPNAKSEISDEIHGGDLLQIVCNNYARGVVGYVEIITAASDGKIYYMGNDKIYHPGSSWAAFNEKTALWEIDMEYAIYTKLINILEAAFIIAINHMDYLGLSSTSLRSCLSGIQSGVKIRIIAEMARKPLLRTDLQFNAGLYLPIRDNKCISLTNGKIIDRLHTHMFTYALDWAPTHNIDNVTKYMDYVAADMQVAFGAALSGEKLTIMLIENYAANMRMTKTLHGCLYRALNSNSIRNVSDWTMDATTAHFTIGPMVKVFGCASMNGESCMADYTFKLNNIHECGANLVNLFDETFIASVENNIDEFATWLIGGAVKYHERKFSKVDVLDDLLKCFINNINVLPDETLTTTTITTTTENNVDINAPVNGGVELNGAKITNANHLHDFITTKLVITANGSITASELYSLYVSYCAGVNLAPYYSKVTIGKEIGKLPGVRKYKRTVIEYRGVCKHL